MATRRSWAANRLRRRACATWTPGQGYTCHALPTSRSWQMRWAQGMKLGGGEMRISTLGRYRRVSAQTNFGTYTPKMDLHLAPMHGCTS